MVAYMSENPWKDQTPEAARLEKERRVNEIRTPEAMDTGFSLSPEESADLEKMTSPGARDYIVKTDRENSPVADVVGAQLGDVEVDASNIMQSGVSENVNRVLREDPKNPGIHVGQLTNFETKVPIAQASYDTTPAPKVTEDPRFSHVGKNINVTNRITPRTPVVEKKSLLKRLFGQ